MTEVEEAVPGKHILVDMSGSGTYAIVVAPENWEAEKPRSLQLNGRNVEHVDTDANGVWCYRAM